MKKIILIFVLTLLYNGMANAIEWFDGKQPVSYCIKTKTAPVDEHILIDQLMLDNKTNRKFYVIPTKIHY